MNNHIPEEDKPNVEFGEIIKFFGETEDDYNKEKSRLLKEHNLEDGEYLEYKSIVGGITKLKFIKTS